MRVNTLVANYFTEDDKELMGMNCSHVDDNDSVQEGGGCKGDDDDDDEQPR
jgi:hypothetical protein